MEYNFLSLEDNLEDLTYTNLSELYNHLYYNKYTCKFYRLNEITANYSIKNNNTFSKLHYLTEINTFFIIFDIIKFEQFSFNQIVQKLKFVLDKEYIEKFKESLVKVKHLKKLVEVGGLDEIDHLEEPVIKYYFNRKELIKHIQAAAHEFKRYIDFNDFKELSFIKTQVDKNKWKPRTIKSPKYLPKQTTKSNETSKSVQGLISKHITTTKRIKATNSDNINHIYKDFRIGDETKQIFCLNLLEHYIEPDFLKEILEWNINSSHIYNYLH